MKKMGKEFGDDLGEDFESAVDEAMADDGGRRPRDRHADALTRTPASEGDRDL